MRVGAAALAVLVLAGCGGGPSFGERLQHDLARTRAFKLRPEPRALAHAHDELTAADPQQQLDAYFAALADLRRQGYVLRRP